MPWIGRVVTAALAGAVVSATAAQDAVQWRVEDGGNGHWYRLGDEIGTWAESREGAEELGAHLATITSGEELDHLLSLETGSWTRHMGASDHDLDGEWEWVTGEPFEFTSWGYLQPSGVECCGQLGHENGPWGTGFMDSLASYQAPAIFEWSADCNDDGIVDYGQILDGTYADGDGNGVPDCCEAPCVGDLNGDDVIGPPDLGILLALWNTDGSPNGADINGDGNVNAVDLGSLIAAWGECSGCN